MTQISVTLFSGMNNGSYQGNNNEGRGRKIAADSEVFLDSLSRAIINDTIRRRYLCN